MRSCTVRDLGRMGYGAALELQAQLTAERKQGLVGDQLLLVEHPHVITVGRNGHWPKVPAWLSGGYVERTTGNDLDSGGTTVDQVAAQHIGMNTPMASFELGIDQPRTGGSRMQNAATIRLVRGRKRLSRSA